METRRSITLQQLKVVKAINYDGRPALGVLSFFALVWTSYAAGILFFDLVMSMSAESRNVFCPPAKWVNFQNKRHVTQVDEHMKRPALYTVLVCATLPSKTNNLQLECPSDY